VLGRDFFSEIAPCADVQEFFGRFREGVARGHLDCAFDYTFPTSPTPRHARVTLWLDPRDRTVWVFIQS